MQACAFTGYRPEKLPFGSDETHPDCEKLKQRIYCETLRLTREGVSVFIVGAARGIDTYAAEIVLELRHTLPERQIELWVAVPYERQASAWCRADQIRYEKILYEADRVEQISTAYTRGCLLKRNRWMVDHATHLIAVYDGLSGGTQYTVNYARQRRLHITIIEP